MQLFLKRFDVAQVLAVNFIVLLALLDFHFQRSEFLVELLEQFVVVSNLLLHALGSWLEEFEIHRAVVADVASAQNFLVVKFGSRAHLTEV